MLVVLPYCARDVQLASQLLDYLPPLGPYVGHQALLIHPPGAPDLAQKAAQSFATVVSLEVPDVNGGWPFGPNAMFSAAALYPHEGPWYFFEPDNTPTRPGWLDELQTEYLAVHKPCMGAVVPTRVMRQGTEIQDGSHMVGTGIYPADFASNSALFDTIPNTAAPWDVYLQWEILQRCHATNLIQHVWNTKEARWKGKTISVKPAHPVARPAQLRHKTAAVIHGVKDSSLMRLLKA